MGHRGEREGARPTTLLASREGATPTMSSTVSRTVERPIGRYAPPDWHSRNSKLSEVARNTRDYSHALRQEAKQLRIDAEAKTKWFNYENNVKLNERVRNITEWRDKLDQCLKDINLEISVQKDAKEACERALEAKNMPLEIVLENLNVREARQEFDVVKDDVEHQLNSEVQLIENIKDKLRMRAEEAWDSLAKLEEIREVVQLGLKDKNEALDIDMQQLDLTESSAGISHKPDAVRVPKGSVVPETWYTFSENNKMMAEQAMAESQRLREAIFHSIEQTSNDLRVQQDATNFDFRKRHYEMKRAKEELEYQMKATRNEISDQELNIADMEAAIRAKENPLKLAETRLENRTFRPHVELCRDEPQDGLTMEVQALKDTIHQLNVKLDHSRETLTELEAHLHKLEEDHKNKQLALALDTRCMDTRKRLGCHDNEISAGYDKTQKLTGILRQNTRYLENSKHAKY